MSPASGPTFTLLDDDEIAAFPNVSWLVDGVIPMQGFVELLGEKGALKTFTALDIAACVQTGLDWAGRRVTHGPVIYVYAEGRTGIGQRLDAWKRNNGLCDASGSISTGLLFLPQRVAMNEPDQTGALLTAIEARLDDRRPVLVVVDTLNRNSTGNENSSEDMSAFVRGCDRIRESTGAAILVVHHTGYSTDDRGRGSSVLEAAADTVLRAKRDADRLVIDCLKQKDGPEFAPIHFLALQIGNSLALRPSGPTEGDLKGQRLEILEVLHREYTDGEGATFMAWMNATGLRKSSFDKARSWLADRGYVTVAGKHWRVAEAGRLALLSTRSTAGPLGQSGPGSAEVHSSGGVRSHPRVDRDLSTARGEAA